MRPLYQDYHINGFIFDFDGTLAVPTLDFAVMRGKTLEAVQKITDIPVPPNMPLVEQLKALCAVLPPKIAQKVQQTAYATIKEVELEASQRSSLFPFVRPMLEKFQAKDLHHAIVTRNCREAVLTVFPDAQEFCSVIITRDDVKHVKPHPEHLEKALHLLNLPPANALMIGDHPMDIEVGKRVHTLTAGVASGETSYEKLAETEPTFMAEDVGYLMSELGIL